MRSCTFKYLDNFNLNFTYSDNLKQKFAYSTNGGIKAGCLWLLYFNYLKRFGSLYLYNHYKILDRPHLFCLSDIKTNILIAAQLIFQYIGTTNQTLNNVGSTQFGDYLWKTITFSGERYELSNLTSQSSH